MTPVVTGSLQSFMDALVGLEQTISPDLSLSRWRPVNIDPPAVYNWINPSPSDIPATGIARDRLTLGVRIIMPTSDVEEIAAGIETYYDQARDVIDADLIEPARSVLVGACLMCQRTSTRSIVDTFNQIEYLGLELTLQAELRRRFA